MPYDKFEAEIQGKRLILKWDLTADEILDVKYDLERYGEAGVWADMWESYSSNGSFTPIDPETHMIGLTSDPYIIGEDVIYEDSGDIIVYHRVFNCPSYMISSPIDDLLDTGQTELAYAFDCGEGGELYEAHYNRIVA